MPAVELSDAAVGFEPGFLGMLPMRDDPELGIEVRFVYPDSPAAKAGLKEGDRIMKVGPAGGQPAAAFAGRDQFAALMSRFASGADVSIAFKPKGDDKEKTVTARLVEMPDSVPNKIPAKASLEKALEPIKAVGAPPKKDPPKKEEPKKDDPKKEEKKEAETGLIKRKEAATDREYWFYVPRNYDPNIAYGLVVWLHPAGIQGRDADDMTDLWARFLRDFNLIMVAPVSKNANGWIPSEAGEVREVVQKVMREYTVDKSRVVAHGSGAGGQMAYYLGFHDRDLFRGVAAHGAALGNNPKDLSPAQRLQFYIIAGNKDPNIEAIRASKPALTAKKYSVVLRELTNIGKQYLDEETMSELLVWIDSMDRQ